MKFKVRGVRSPGISDEEAAQRRQNAFDVLLGHQEPFKEDCFLLKTLDKEEQPDIIEKETIMTNESWTCELRNTSDSDSFPWLSQKVPLVLVSPSRQLIKQAKNKTDKRRLLREIHEGDILLAAWPGQWSQDVFVVDDVSQLADSLY